MGAQDFQRIKIPGPAAPANNGTVTLFDSTVHFAKSGLSLNGVERVRLSFPGLDQASAAGGLIGYSSPDKGATWFPFKFGSTSMPATVAVDDGTDHSSYDFFVGTEEDIKFTFTAGAAAPTVWWPLVFVKVGDDHAGA